MSGDAPFLTNLALDDTSAAQIAHYEELEAREASYADVPARLHPKVRERLEVNGFERLYSHQAQATEAALRGEDVLVVTGTNSGKSLCYNLPALHLAATEPVCRLLYLFPTKALAQDQLGRLDALAGPLLQSGTYDGDTPKTQRTAIRRLSNAVLTNPDMLHVGILPSHENWTPFLKALRLIVIDEMHVYRGVFGSHVGNVLRRLLRLCAWRNNRPQIIACSATIGNPIEAFRSLTGRNPLLITEDGSPQAKRTFVFFNPPLLPDGSRYSTNAASADVLGTLVESGQRTLAFSRSRVAAELVLKYARSRLSHEGIVSPSRLESYRAGYTPKERRTIEQGLHKGTLLGLSATNAMELGVDVGGLDAVVMNGYPGSVASFRQQAGRAGRGVRPGLAVFVAQDDPLEQFLLHNPDTILKASSERISLNPENPHILTKQLLCAAHERPIAPTELEQFGPTALQLAEELDRTGELAFRGGMFFYPSVEPPAFKVNIRGSSGDTVHLMLEADEIGTMEYWRALTSAHTGAVYLHRGATFVVTDLNLELLRATLVADEVSYFTQPLVQSVIQSKFTIAQHEMGPGRVALVGVSVTDAVVGFRKKSLENGAVLDTQELDLPPSTYESIAVRFDLPFEPIDLEDPLASGGVHALEHALAAMAPLFAGCDRNDLGSAWYALHPDSFAPCVFVIDRTPGGVGLAERLFDASSEWVEATRQMVASCECEDGCPRCLLSSRCEANNEPLAKRRVIQLLNFLTQRP